MPFPFARALPILRGVSELSGEDFDEYATGTELVAWLEARGETWNATGFISAIMRLEEAGYVKAEVAMAGGAPPGYAVSSIELAPRGAELVEGWPSAGSIDAEALGNAIVTALAAQADNPDTPEEAKGFLRKLGEGAVSTVVTTAVTAGMASAGLG